MAKHLVQRGHKVTVMVIADNRKVGIVESEWDGVRIIETPDLLWGRLRSGWDIWGMINRLVYLRRDMHPYDLLHCFETRPATIYPALFYRNKHKTLCLTDWNDWWGHGGLIDINRPSWYRVIFGGIETYYEEAYRTNCSGLTVISEALEHRAVKLGIPQDNICHIPGGASLDYWIPRTQEECRNRIGFPMSEPILCFSSGDSHFDLEIVMAALNIVARKYPSVKLVITGHAKKSIRDLAKKYGVDGNVHLTGYLPMEELPWYMSCANIFVLPFPNTPYNVGRWPNKMCNYMCLGRPTISNPVGDIQKLFERHNVGLLADFEPTDFALKIMSLLENSELAEQIGQNARHVAVTHYDWKILAGKLEAFYYQILET